MRNNLPTRVPSSTYRFQFNHFFTFSHATALIPYLHELGISDLYASPYLQARPGSLHGYDITNHNALNPEIGGTEEHERMIRELREHGMGHLLDIVPNHMGIGGDNPWWMDVLENGQSSPFAPYFDIDWHPLKPELDGKVLLPILGDQFGAVLERGEFELHFKEGRFWIDYFEHHLPVAPRSTTSILREALSELALPSEHIDRLELESIVTALEHLPPRSRTDEASVAERRREKEITQRRLVALYDSSAAVQEALDAAVRRFNGTQGDSASFDPLEALLDDQAYRLAFWRVAAEEINYRRFFDINDLAGVRVEVPEVFDATHGLILRLLADGKLSGLRIDHPDGLFDPRHYLLRLQEEVARQTGRSPLYVLVEKILTGDEALPRSWPVAGTVGYDFLNRLNGLFVAKENEEAMSATYARFTRPLPEFDELEYRKKKLILRSALASELNVLADLLNDVSEANRRSRDFTLGSLTDALREIIACFPIYRTYIDAYAERVTDGDRHYVERAVREAKRRNPATSPSIFDFLRNVLLLRWPENLGENARDESARFVMKFQQLTGPVMAKGVEDTSFYVYNRLVSLNEVGGAPDHFGVSVEEFHEFNRERAEHWPHAMNSTSTHDTKRSEDVRARINVLSELPTLWDEHVIRWREFNAGKKRREEGGSIPDANDEYLLYQSLVGAWPLEPVDAQTHQAFVGRIQEYMEKATREAKVHTSWINPNEAYDAGVQNFVARILSPDGDNLFLQDFVQFHERIRASGMRNALAQMLFKLTCPGVPDLYQGQEMWDFSLVDPDNRRPVDYASRQEALRALCTRLEEEDRGEIARELLASWKDGRIKMYVTYLALRLRRAHPELFREGEYTPLFARGARAGNVVGFARRWADEERETSVIVAVPRLTTMLMADPEGPWANGNIWGKTTLIGPALLAGRYRDVLTGTEIEARGEGEESVVPVRRLLGSFPAALLERIG